MIRKLILPLLVLGMVASSILAPAASANTKQVYIEHLENAYALIYVEDECFRISGLVVIGEEKVRGNTDERRDGNSVRSFLDVYDACAQQWVLMAEAGRENANVRITPNLRSASLNDTLIARNYLADEDVEIHFALDWQGFGKKSHSRDVLEVEYPGPDGTTIHAISKAGFHWMEALVTGSIAIGDHVIAIQSDDAQIVGVKANTHQTAK
jgi:hypothetical protein